ncbi:MAG: SLC13/DASS family transporter, partial [Desulfobacteraceae bacterium]|nr:SLC13/DASS family transporter [Desulfobacteraceae bacterium]
MTTDVKIKQNKSIKWKKIGFLLLGLLLFAIVYWAPAWPDAVDPTGKIFTLSVAGKGAIAVFLLAATWWISEVVPIGVTSLAIGVLQVLFLIRPANKAFTDFMDPNVLFIYGSLMIGLVFTKTGLTRRIAYKMLGIVGEKTSMIYLGCFILTSALTHIMAHTAVAATIYPLLITIYAMYGKGDEQTRFGKGLFMGMAYIAGAGSIVTLLGAARGAVALGFYSEVTGKSIGFFELSYYMFPIGWLMTFLLWGYFMVVLKPEKKTIPGLKKKAIQLNKELGGITRQEIVAAVIVGATVLVLGICAVLKTSMPGFVPPHKTAVLLVSTILFFATDILDTKDLQAIPWNIILLFAGAMSIGFCLWQTGAAEWMAINYLAFFQESSWFVFVLSIAFLVMIMTNFIMNV